MSRRSPGAEGAGKGSDGLADKGWVDVQKKTFTNWVNDKLKETDKHVDELKGDLQDGTSLIMLLQVLAPGKKMPGKWVCYDCVLRVLAIVVYKSKRAIGNLLAQDNTKKSLFVCECQVYGVGTRFSSRGPSNYCNVCYSCGASGTRRFPRWTFTRERTWILRSGF